jgi:hypothetical protein
LKFTARNFHNNFKNTVKKIVQKTKLIESVQKLQEFVIPALFRRQEDHEFEASPGYIAASLCLKKQNNKKLLGRLRMRQPVFPGQLGIMAHAFQLIYGRKPKMGGWWSRLAWAKSKTLSQK